MMLGNRRNFVFRVSIVINIVVLLYAALHLSGNGAPGVEWVPITVDGSERTAEFRYLNRDEVRNETETRPIESSVKNIEESTSQKTPSTMATTNKTASSTASIAELEKKLLSIVPSEPETTNETILDIVDENALTDATLARLRTLLGCNEKDFLPQTIQRGDFWVLKNYVRADHGIILCHETITYTTHAGFEFLDNVQPLVERWMAPVSLAIHAPGADLAPTVDSIRYLRDCLNNDLIRQYVTFHVFFSNKHIPSKIPDPETFLLTPFNCTSKPPYNVDASSTYMKSKSLLYPVNVARNVARDSALTHFILPSDIELYPSPNLIPRFLNMIARNEKPLNSTKPRVFPISIFEVDAKVQVPSTKTELQAMLIKKTAIPFHKYVCPNCHNIPQGQQWMNAAETSQMDVFHVGKRRGKYVHWEPIFIGTHQDPYYDERLSWEGKKDKMTQGYILCVKDYDFMILNNAFLIHKPGIKHYAKNPKRDAIAGRQSSFVKNVIMPELKKLYGVRNGCAL
ncbi:PREDICTED: beta-1,4-glucuronyltransferase 1 [Papilio xuthus]|uniref:Beta-1,4-glucuronyltransferase 1 n=2 Tax=Papilio xuthus TaxID=66420 RepID=A0AAJ7E8E7_PAPXU|nr:PREDICTED: beta-1,4-glucuronyltransferase 1 [Papilio xuthus]XP_013166938.1 PREDICTED: beta-1,4-glucuronyltransferase 1 [Papilio xuthus]